MTTQILPKHSRSSSSSHNDLPFELEREICEIAATKFPGCIPSIILVAHRFRIWFEPELYRIIRSAGRSVFPPLYFPKQNFEGDDSNILDISRIRRFGPHVQHVLLQRRTAEEIASILECCPNVSNLALWVIRGTCTPLLPVLEKLTVQKLSFDPSVFFNSSARPETAIPFDQPAFLNLTHLRIINATSSWSKWSEIALLPKLSHLALQYSSKQHFVDQILQQCASLELLVMFLEYLPIETRFSHTDDRVVLLRAVGYVMHDWEMGARYGDDFWMKAQIKKEERIQARKRTIQSE